jgi:CheY-like chemotaxis protein
MDPSQVDQVVANLAVNARDAMPDGGRLTIETLNVTLDDAYSRAHADARPGDFVMLAVSDNGCGMDAATLDRVFEPFFTTKPEGQGTGLGLATVYGIARQNQGSIEVYSEPGRGTTMRVYLPRCLDAREASRDAAAAALPAQGHETVLLVEDEPMLRELGRELLEELGYHVLSAAGPTEALAIAARKEQPIDLLLTDVVMPVMSGKDLAERLTAARPGLRVVFTSGYTANVIARSGMLDPGIEFLAKPFTMAGLASKVRDVLNRPR